jgi:hypothetical protein
MLDGILLKNINVIRIHEKIFFIVYYLIIVRILPDLLIV